MRCMPALSAAARACREASALVMRCWRHAESVTARAFLFGVRALWNTETCVSSPKLTCCGPLYRPETVQKRFPYRCLQSAVVVAIGGFTAHNNILFINILIIHSSCD